MTEPKPSVIAALPVVGHVMMAFPTPVLMRKWPESEGLNQALRDLVLAKERESTGVAKSNAGGWHSDETLFDWSHPAIGELRRRVDEVAREITESVCGEAVKGLRADVKVTGWANVSRDRAYNHLHSHPHCTWSGVYYVTLGQSDPAARYSGIIEFTDPRMAVDWLDLPGQPFGSQLRLTPEAGGMLMFPSWLWHWVHPFQGSGERISIAFNVRLKFRPA